MNYAWNTEIIWKHFHDHQGKFVYCCAFNHSFAQNIRSSFFKWKFFLFKELSKIFKDFGGNFKDFSRISNNFSIQGLFKDMTLFQGLFRARVSHVSVNIKNNAEKDKSGSFQIKPWVAFRLPYLLIELFFIGVPMVSTVGRTYGHITIKIYRMHRSPNFLTHGAPL